MSGFKCPYCNSVFPLTVNTIHETKVYFMQPSIYNGDDNSETNISFYKCPNCDEYIVHAKGFGYKVRDIDMQLRPLSSAMQFPDYIPIRTRMPFQ